MRFKCHFLLATGAVLMSIIFAGGQLMAQQSADPKVSSKIPGIEIRHLTQLPKAPPSAQSQGECNAAFPPTTAEGQVVNGLGWGVTGEAKLGPYDAVSFAGEFEPSTAGSCEIDQGNIALFNGSQLVMIIYVTKSSKLSIGRVIADGDGLRIVDGSLAQLAVGEVRLVGDHAVEITPITAEQSVCGGKEVVPKVDGKPVSEARKQIIAKGWEPFRSPPPAYQDFVGDSIRKSGIIEATDCSETDSASCSYYYRKGDMELSLTTHGDQSPTVDGHQVACDRSKWHKAN